MGGLVHGSKQALKLVKIRIEHIKRKKQVIVCILKKDIADLIAGGRKDDAFKRVEFLSFFLLLPWLLLVALTKLLRKQVDALIVQMNLASCYEMIEGFCDCIINQLPTLQKTKY